MPILPLSIKVRCITNQLSDRQIEGGGKEGRINFINIFLRDLN